MSSNLTSEPTFILRQITSITLCIFLQSPVTSSLSGTTILVSTLSSITLSLRSSLNVRDQVLHTYNNRQNSVHFNLSSLETANGQSDGRHSRTLKLRNLDRKWLSVCTNILYSTSLQEMSAHMCAEFHNSTVWVD